MKNVVLDWGDDAPIEVPAVWLRHNCPCDQCRVNATSERRILIDSESDDVEPQDLRFTDQAIEVQWKNHTSVLTKTWLESLRASLAQQARQSTFWQGDSEPATFEYASVWDVGRSGDQAALEMIDIFEDLGVVRVRGVPTKPGTCAEFISRWAPVREMAFGRMHDVLADPEGYNIAHTAEALPPHNDMASCGSPPGGQIIHMLTNDSLNGDSVLVDGWSIASQLSDVEINVLSSVWVPFRQFSAAVETWTRAPLLRVDEQGHVVHLRYSNQLMQALDPHHPRIEEFYQAYTHLTHLLLEPANQMVFRLEAGDLLLLHNHRVLHGRTEFLPSTGQRHLQDVYFEFEDLLNHRRVLNERL